VAYEKLEKPPRLSEALELNPEELKKIKVIREKAPNDRRCMMYKEARATWRSA